MREVVRAEDSRLRTHDWEEGERLEDALLTAFETAGVDVGGRDPPLVEFVDPDALGQLRWSNPELAVRTRVWGHPVRISRGSIEVFAPRGEGARDAPGGSGRER